MKGWHPWQLKKLKFWVPFWSYQLNCTANLAYYAIFSITMGAVYSFELNSIKTHIFWTY